MANYALRGLWATSRGCIRQEKRPSLQRYLPVKRARLFTLLSPSRSDRFCLPFPRAYTERLGSSRRLPPYPTRDASTNAKDKPPAQPLSSAPERDARNAARSPLTTLTTYENIYTIPNILTFSRLAATPVIGYLVLNDQNVAAVSLFAYAGITDLVDGWIARRWNMQTVVGTVIDPMADKALMTVLTVCLAIKGLLPMYLTTLILGRDISLAIAAIYYRFISLPPPRTLARYWDFSLPSAEVHPTTISKANTVLQLLLIGSTVALPVFGPSVEAMMAGFENEISLDDAMTSFQWLVAGTTVWSGASYLYTSEAVKILTGTEEQRRQSLRKGRMVIAATFATCLIVAFGFPPKGPKAKENTESVSM